MKRVLTLGLLLAFLIVGMAGCAKKENAVVAKVGDRKITLGELQSRFLAQMKMAAASGMDIPKQEDILEGMIQRELLVVYAYRQGLDKDEKTDSLLREREKSLLLEELYSLEIANKSKPNKAEIKSFYNKLKEKIRAKHILVKTQKEADSLYAALKKGENFEKLAQLKSMDKFTAVKGGDLGFFTWGNMVEPFQKTAFALKIGEISKPVKTRFGWHIIKLEEKQKTDIPALEGNQETYSQELERVKQAELMTQYFEKLKKDEDLKVDSLAFTVLLAKASQIDTMVGERWVRGDINVDLFAPLERAMILVKYQKGQMNLEQFVARFADLPPNLRFYGFNNEEGLKDLVFQMLLPELLVQSAYARGIDKTESFKEKILDLKESQMASKMREQFILDTVKVTPQEVEEFYQRNKNIYLAPAVVHIQEIMLGSKEEAEEVLKQVKSGADFSRIAREKTIRQYAREKGGDLGYIQQSQVPELFETGMKLKVGQIGGPVYFTDPRFGEAYSVIKVLDKKKEEQKNFSQVEEDAQVKALWERRNKVLDNWEKKARQETKVEIDQKVLGTTNKDISKAEG